MEPLLTHVDAVVFDLDGTLVETNIDFPLMRREMISLAASAGLAPGPLAGEDILGIVRIACEHLETGMGPQQAADLRERALATLEEIEMRHAADTTEIPFARELVGMLRENGIGVGIATRNCRRASDVSLAIAGITPDVLVCREDAARQKPDPDQLHLALNALGARAERSVMVGDHLMDVQSGKAAGMKTIGFLREKRPAEFFDEVAPDLVVHDLREVLDALIRSDR